MDGETKKRLFVLYELMVHNYNKAQQLTNADGDNIGVFVPIEVWRKVDKLLDEIWDLYKEQT
jgi:hypothetical protein